MPFVEFFRDIEASTDWEGTYGLVDEEGRIAMIADYIYYPHGQKRPDNVKRLVKTFYL